MYDKFEIAGALVCPTKKFPTAHHPKTRHANNAKKTQVAKKW
jgi:hypothetical protein